MDKVTRKTDLFSIYHKKIKNVVTHSWHIWYIDWWRDAEVDGTQRTFSFFHTNTGLSWLALVFNEMLRRRLPVTFFIDCSLRVAIHLLQQRAISIAGVHPVATADAQMSVDRQNDCRKKGLDWRKNEQAPDSLVPSLTLLPQQHVTHPRLWGIPSTGLSWAVRWKTNLLFVNWPAGVFRYAIHNNNLFRRVAALPGGRFYDWSSCEATAHFN